MLEDILKVIPAGLKKYQKRIKGTQERKRFFEVPYPLLNRLEPLLKWLEVNAHLLEGHPSRDLLDAGEHAVGIFEERLVALPRETMEEILGALPEAVKERRWAGKRLVEIEIGVEL